MREAEQKIVTIGQAQVTETLPYSFLGHISSFEDFVRERAADVRERNGPVPVIDRIDLGDRSKFEKWRKCARGRSPEGGGRPARPPAPRPASPASINMFDNFQ